MRSMRKSCAPGRVGEALAKLEQSRGQALARQMALTGTGVGFLSGDEKQEIAGKTQALATARRLLRAAQDRLESVPSSSDRCRETRSERQTSGRMRNGSGRSARRAVARHPQMQALSPKQPPLRQAAGHRAPQPSTLFIEIGRPDDDSVLLFALGAKSALKRSSCGQGEELTAKLSAGAARSTGRRIARDTQAVATGAKTGEQEALARFTACFSPSGEGGSTGGRPVRSCLHRLRWRATGYSLGSAHRLLGKRLMERFAVSSPSRSACSAGSRRYDRRKAAGGGQPHKPEVGPHREYEGWARLRALKYAEEEGAI